MAPEDLNAPAVPDAQNAVVDLRAAAAAIGNPKALWEPFRDRALGLPLTDEEAALLRKVVGGHEAALAAVARAAGKTRVDWDLHFRSPMIQSPAPPDLAGQRYVTQLLNVAVLYAHHAGDDAEAVRRIRQTLFIARAVDEQPTLVAHQVSQSMVALAAAEVRLIAPDLQVAADAPAAAGLAAAETGGSPASREQLKALSAELLDPAGPLEGQRQALRGERVAYLDTLTTVLSGKAPLTRQGGAVVANDPTDRIALYLRRPLTWDAARVAVDYLAAAIDAADAPDWPTCRASMSNPLRDEIESHPQRHAFVLNELPSLDRAQLQHYRGLTDRRLAAVALAVRCYAIDHGGARPGRLSDLVPGYFAAVPLDPLSAGQALRYVPGDDPIVYSVGDNGTDGGGSEAKLSGYVLDIDDWDREDRVVHLTRRPRPPPPPVEVDPDAR